MGLAEQMRDFTFGSMVLRLVLEMTCGGVLGYGRSQQERPAGLRTYMLVCVSAAAAVLVGALIGLERSAKNRPAGFRTHMLVCLGRAVAAMTGLYIFLVLKLPSDVSRLSAQVISGLGFIGAGTIVVTKKCPSRA